jgi:hypothetical protein
MTAYIIKFFPPPAPFHLLQHLITCLLRDDKVGCTPCRSEALAEEPPPLLPKRGCLASLGMTKRGRNASLPLGTNKAGQRRFATSSKIKQPLPFIHTQYSPNRSLLLQILCQRNYMKYSFDFTLILRFS